MWTGQRPVINQGVVVEKQAASDVECYEDI